MMNTENIPEEETGEFKRLAKIYKQIKQRAAEHYIIPEGFTLEEFQAFDAEISAKPGQTPRNDEEYFAVCREVPRELIAEAAQHSGVKLADMTELVLFSLRQGIAVDDLLLWLHEFKADAEDEPGTPPNQENIVHKRLRAFYEPDPSSN
jgi:hypothetical protein